MMTNFNILYGTKWPLLYQADDRFRHEEFPEILRKQSERYDRMGTKGLWPADFEDSEYDQTRLGTTSSGLQCTDHRNKSGGSIT